MNDVDPATRVFGPDPDMDRPTLKRWWASWPRIPLSDDTLDADAHDGGDAA